MKDIGKNIFNLIESLLKSYNIKYDKISVSSDDLCYYILILINGYIINRNVPKELLESAKFLDTYIEHMSKDIVKEIIL